MPDIRCIIIEDEPLAARVLSEYVAELPYLQLTGIFKDALLAAESLHRQTVDLIFLDIHLPRLMGLDFLRTLPVQPAVIVTTAHHEYAVESFDLQVTDYLLKPFSFDRFLKAVQRVPLPQMAVERDFIFLNVQKKKVKILFSDILYIESQREYVRVVCRQQEYLSKMSTHEILDILPAARFFRLHRSFIVSLEKMTSYTAETVEIGGVEIPVGREYRERFLSAMSC
jgi:two-component system, LytTR family, response regulator